MELLQLLNYCGAVAGVAVCHWTGCKIFGISHEVSLGISEPTSLYSRVKGQNEKEKKKKTKKKPLVRIKLNLLT